MDDLIDRLRSEAEISDRPGQYDRLNELADEFAAALQAAREDAERYRWLRNHYGLGALHRADHHLIITRCEAYSGAAEGLDRSIDAAIAAEKKEGE